MNRSWLVVCLGAMCAALGGCAHVWTDAGGTRHVLGLVSMEIPPAKGVKAGGGEFVRISSFGVSVIRSELETGIAIGYQSYGSTWLDGNSCLAPALLVSRGMNTQ